jgi:hypothetical protein
MVGQAGAIEQVQGLTQALSFPAPALNADTVANTAAAATAIANNFGADFSPASDLSHSLDSSVVGGQAGAVANTVAGAAGGQVVSDPAGHLTGALSSVTSGDPTAALGGTVPGGLTSGLGHGADLASGLGGAVGSLTNSLNAAGAVDSVHADAVHVVATATNHIGEIEHNATLGDVTNHAAVTTEHSTALSGNVVHDVVSDGGNQIGIGQVAHVEVGNVLSGNEVHISH